ncbi:MAG: hypothetical protein AAB571_00430 [Chloroflexota bacterium]
MNATTRAPLSNLQLTTLRLTTFHEAATDAASLESFYKQTVGVDPESVVKQREGFQADGPFNDGRIVLASPSLSVPRRIDWLYTSFDEAALSTGLEDSLKGFKRLMAQWFQKCPLVKRLALGVIVLLPVESAEKGYQRLLDYLPSIKIDVAGSSDFLYQINRPRRSKILADNLEINRLSKWSVNILGHAQIGIDGGVPQLQQEGETFACRIELDINTSAKFKGVLPQEKLQPLLDELDTLALEILREGDIL